MYCSEPTDDWAVALAELDPTPLDDAEDCAIDEPELPSVNDSPLANPEKRSSLIW